MNDDLKNCILQLCGIAQNLGVVAYQNVARMLEQNPEGFSEVYKPLSICEYLIGLFNGPIFFAQLNEADRVTLENCEHYIESVKPEGEGAI